MNKYLCAVLVGMLVNCTAIAAQALTLEWTRNAESDMKQYHVYVCKVKACTATNAGALWVGTVPQPASGIKPSFVLPANTEGAVAVTAEDLTGNTSGASVSLPFSSFVDLPVGAPATPAGLLLKP